MTDADGGYFFGPQKFGGFDASVASNDLLVCIDQDGRNEPKRLDAFGELLYLALAVQTRVLGIHPESFDCNAPDLELRT